MRIVFYLCQYVGFISLMLGGMAADSSLRTSMVLIVPGIITLYLTAKMEDGFCYKSKSETELQTKKPPGLIKHKAASIKTAMKGHKRVIKQ